jgi:hypothetical protein
MPTQSHPILFENNHIFIEIENNLWVYDTGSDKTFGKSDLTLLNQRNNIAGDYLGITAEQISDFVDEDVAGIIGVDILNRYDHIIDLKNNLLTVSDEELAVDGHSQPLEFFMGLPTLFAMIENRPRNFVFDTGAPISYYQDDIPQALHLVQTSEDFHPGFGEFECESYFFNIELFGVRHNLQFGQLPEMMGMALGMTGCEGIIGNEIMRNRITGYFPRRKELVLQI